VRVEWEGSERRAREEFEESESRVRALPIKVAQKVVQKVGI
jgi:hypothetical protein